MSTVKKSVSIDNIVPEALTDICGIIVFLILDVVFVTRNIFGFSIFFICVTFDSRCLLLIPAKSIIQINKDIGSIHLNQGFIACFQEHGEILVQV
jgi:hypothetical protein